MNLITLTVNSTHFYLLDCKGGKLLVDAGWEMAKFTAQLKAYKISFSDIKYVMFTHHHPDHAGLVQAVKEASGARLIIHKKQIPFLENLLEFAAKKPGMARPIHVEKSDLISPDQAALQAIGVQGEIVETPGHSLDSISLALESGAAFIGDLPPPGYSENDEQVRDSWRKLINLGGQTFYHSHAAPFTVERIRRLMTG